MAEGGRSLACASRKKAGMTDIDDDWSELSELRRVRQARNRRADRRAKSASSPGLRGDPALLSRSTAARRSTARTAISSSGSTPCASTAFAPSRSAATLLEPLDHQGLLTGRRSGRGDDEIDDDELPPSWASRRARPHHGAASCPFERRKEGRRRDRQPRQMRGFRAVQAALRAGAKGARHGRPGDAPLRAQGRNCPRAFVHRRRPEGLCRREGRETFTQSGSGRPPARHLRQRDREQHAHALAAARPEQGRYRAADHRPVGRPPVWLGSHRWGEAESGTIYVLRSKSEHPVVAEHRDLLHKIGVTGWALSGASPTPAAEPTFLMAEVEIVATYELYNINSRKLETLIHRIFEAAGGSTSRSWTAFAGPSAQKNGSSCRCS